MEMLHVMLKYTEVYTNLDFGYIPTTPLELSDGVAINKDNNKEAEYGAYEGSTIDSVRCVNNPPQCIRHTPNPILNPDNLKLSKILVDKITPFYLRPPEFIKLLDNVG